MKEKRNIYYVELEVVKKGADYILGFVNISHIPYNKLEEIFEKQITDERFIFDDSRSYEIDKKLYLKHKRFFDREIPFKFEFDLFNYSVRLSSDDFSNYKKNYYDDLPTRLFNN